MQPAQQKKREFGGKFSYARIIYLTLQLTKLEGVFMLIQYGTKIQRPLLNRYLACDEADIILCTVVNCGKLLKKFYFLQGADVTIK